MKIALTVLSTLALCGCFPEGIQRLPTAPWSPVQPASSVTSVWGLIIDDTGVCIVGATATVVRGQRLGQSIKQTTPCDAWADVGGFVFKDLTPFVEMTLRVSASGYATMERTLVPSQEPPPVVFELSRNP